MKYDRNSWIFSIVGWFCFAFGIEIISIVMGSLLIKKGHKANGIVLVVLSSIIFVIFQLLPVLMIAITPFLKGM